MSSRQLSRTRRFHRPWVWMIPAWVVLGLLTLYSAYVLLVYPRMFWGGYLLLPFGVGVAGLYLVFENRGHYLETSNEHVLIQTPWYSLRATWTDVLGVGRTQNALVSVDCLVIRAGDYTAKASFGVRSDYFLRLRFPDIERAIPLSDWSICDWRRGPLGSEIQRHATGLTPGGWREPTESPNLTLYDDYRAQALAELKAKRRDFQSRCGPWLARSWAFDGVGGTLRFGEPGQRCLTVNAVYLGNYAERLSVWQWAWGNLEVAEPARIQSARMKDLFRITSLHAFENPDPFIVRDVRVTWEFAAVAVRHLGALGCVRLGTSSRGTYACFVVDAPRLSDC